MPDPNREREDPREGNWEVWEVNRRASVARTCERAPIMSPVRYWYTTVDDLGETQVMQGRGLTTNVGSGGLCILMTHHPRVEDVLNIHVQLPDQLIQVPTLGEVRWIRTLPLGAVDIQVVGIRFLL
jgi:hypothetical protein